MNIFVLLMWLDKLPTLLSLPNWIVAISVEKVDIEAALFSYAILNIAIKL